MLAGEWMLTAMKNENKSLINKFDCNWRHPLFGNFVNYRAWLL